MDKDRYPVPEEINRSGSLMIRAAAARDWLRPRHFPVFSDEILKRKDMTSNYRNTQEQRGMGGQLTLDQRPWGAAIV
jgi:hypothetical protein